MGTFTARSPNAKTASSRPVDAPEPVTIIVRRNQIVALIIPHLTPRAVEIRKLLYFSRQPVDVNQQTSTK